MQALDGQVAVVAGATRGAGRGIASMLGEAGATVYCTGRSVRESPATEGRPETIEETVSASMGCRHLCRLHFRQLSWPRPWTRRVTAGISAGVRCSRPGHSTGSRAPHPYLGTVRRFGRCRTRWGLPDPAYAIPPAPMDPE